jgi:phospholipase/carboxylesterase
MNDRSEPEQKFIDGWAFRIQKPEGQRKEKLLLLLHGHLGDENAMWILTNPIPKDYIMLAPRAPVEIQPGRFSWHPIQNTWPPLSMYQKLANQLMRRVEAFISDEDLDIEKMDVMGFSQGAVMGLALSHFYPHRIRKAAILAGFLPRSWQDSLTARPTDSQSFYIAHGTRDDIIPIEKARTLASLLQSKGATVAFCEANTAHKLGANCFQSLGKFFSD